MTPMSPAALVRLLRPKQWTKNLLVFAGIIFGGVLSDPDHWVRVLIAFAAMCLASSGTYALNDAADAERDRRHPKKRNRPVASGAITKAFAIGLGFVLIAVGVALGFYLNRGSGVTILAYLVLQALYNGAMKRVPVADVFGISIGFVLRAILGAACIQVKISGWLLFCTGALALLLGFAKRRHEFLLQGEGRSSSRESLGSYTKEALDALVLASACVAAICYGIYSLNSPTAQTHPGLFLTTPFVFYGICRYILVVFSNGEVGEPETVLLRDPHILGSVVGFIIAAAFAMQGYQLPVIEPTGR